MEAYFKSVDKEDMRIKLESVGARIDLTKVGETVTEAPPAAAAQPTAAAVAPPPAAAAEPRAALPARPAGYPPPTSSIPRATPSPAQGQKPWTDPFDAFKRKRS